MVSNGYTTKCSKPYWSNLPLFFWHSGTLALKTERQSALSHITVCCIRSRSKWVRLQRVGKSHIRMPEGQTVSPHVDELTMPETSFLSQTMYTYAHILLPGLVCSKSWQKSLNREKYIPRGFKVIQDHRIVTNWKGIGDFMLVINSDVSRISHGFGATATYWSKSRFWDLPLSHLLLCWLTLVSRILEVLKHGLDISEIQH